MSVTWGSMTTKRSGIQCVILGMVLLLAMKYVILGIDAWNSILHPGAIPSPNQQSFRKPLLGILG
jgi:hypothetical protein